MQISGHKTREVFERYNIMNELFLPSGIPNILQKLNEHGALYLVIGGYAVRYYGCRKMVDDFDILIKSSIENSENIYPVFKEINYTPNFTVKELSKPGKKIYLEHYLIEIMTSTDKFNFEEAYKSKEIVMEKGLQIPVISLEKLICLKELALKEDNSREHKELEDIECLKSKLKLH